MAKYSYNSPTSNRRSPVKKKTSPPRFKNERSPNAQSKCRRCGVKIRKGEQRFGVIEFNTYSHSMGQTYYHPNCCPSHLKSRVPGFQDSYKASRDHAELVQQLKQLRRVFANRLNVEPYKIWHDSTVDDIVTKLPTSTTELLEVYGIGEDKLKYFGSAILDVVAQYLNSRHTVKQEGAAYSGYSSRASTSLPTSSTTLTAQRYASQNGIEVGETLTAEQIVNIKFEEAARNGEIISVDM